MYCINRWDSFWNRGKIKTSVIILKGMIASIENLIDVV